MTTNPNTTPIREYIQKMLPWAHGHQLKGLTDYVMAILDRQTGNQANLVRELGNQEAALRRLSRLTHNERLSPHKLADDVLAQALSQLPERGQVHLALDWTIEAEQHLLTISLVIHGRAVPIYWRAYTEGVLKGRMRIYEMAMIKRVLTRFGRTLSLHRLRVTADRGFADVELMDLLDSYGIFYVIRARASTKVFVRGEWQQLQALRFVTNSRRRNLGRVRYCENKPHPAWVSLSRVRNPKGEWEVWHLISNHRSRAGQMAADYARRFGCEQGFRDVKRLLGFAEARIVNIQAWSRFFALFAIALLILMTLGTALLNLGKQALLQLLRRVASRRRGRWEVSLVNAILLLLKTDSTLWHWLHPQTTLDLEAALPNVS
jgi:hypothetical protein